MTTSSNFRDPNMECSSTLIGLGTQYAQRQNEANINMLTTDVTTAGEKLEINKREENLVVNIIGLHQTKDGRVAPLLTVQIGARMIEQCGIDRMRRDNNNL